MNPDTLRRLADLFERYPEAWAHEPVDSLEIDDAEARLGVRLSAGLREFIGGVVGSLPLAGLRCWAWAGAGEWSVVELTERHRADRWPGTEAWVVFSGDGFGNPVGVDAEGRVWLSDHDSGECVCLEANFEDWLRRWALKAEPHRTGGYLARWPWPPRDGGGAMSLEWEQLYKLGTDVAGFALYHPGRLAHRNEAPLGWWDEAEEEFRTGRLIAWCTGSDGTFTLKFVQRLLSLLEKKALVTSQAFRFLVEDGRLYWDNTDCLPSEDRHQSAEEDEYGWLELPNGKYRFTVHAFDWFSISDAERKAGGDISHYVVQVESVSSFDGVPAPASAPWLLASKSWHAKRVKEQQGDTE